MAVCVCCQNIVEQLEVRFRDGDDERFFQLWASLLDKAENPLSIDDDDLALMVRFKLHVYFAMVQFAGRDREASACSMQKFANFLKEEGPNYSQFPELAAYYALPYIVNNPNHSLLVDIRKDEWIKQLDEQWKALLKKEIHHSHGFNEKRIEIQSRNYTRLKAKYVKLLEDHKLLLGLATRLVTALENSVNGDTKSTIETFEFYRQEIKTFSDGLEESSKIEKELKESKNKADEVGFQWEARQVARTPSLESIGSKHSQEQNPDT